jgi:hypothetical protein
MTSLTVLTLKSAGARDFHCCAQCLSNEMAHLTMIGRVPVLGLVLELQHSRLPASHRADSGFCIGSGCGFEWLHGVGVGVPARMPRTGGIVKTFGSLNMENILAAGSGRRHSFSCRR